MPEPSGLALDPSGNNLWIVSDAKGQIYKTDLTGKLIDKIDVKSSDYEGVAVSADGQTLYLLDEAKNRITCHNLDGKKIETFDLSEKASAKSGPEGIDIDWKTGNIIVVNEKNPKVLYLLDSQGQELFKTDITSLSDLSAVCVNPKNKEIWMLSDEDQKLLRILPDYSIAEEFLIDVEQMEGLAIDFKKKRIYIISDREEELHIFEY